MRMTADLEADKRLVYEQLCVSYHRVDDLRAKLLGLLPLATAGGILLLLDQNFEGPSAGQLDPTWVAIGVFGCLVTMGLLAYELQGIKRCWLLMQAGQRFEETFRLEGPFAAIQSPYVADVIGAPLAACIIYSTVLAAWAYVALISVDEGAPWISILIFILSLLVSYGLVMQERKSSANSDGPASMLGPVSALVIIDAQQGLLDGKAAIPNARVVVDRIAVLLTAARSAGALIVYLQNDGAPGTIDEPKTTGWFIHPRLTPEPDEMVLRKTGDDGFEGTELEKILAHKHVTRIAVAGLLSEMCVSATVLSAFKKGIEVVLVHDAHGTYNFDGIPSSIVSRVAEHALGDQIELAQAAEVVFNRSAVLNAPA
jgi:streptothricin hydrolase